MRCFFIIIYLILLDFSSLLGQITGLVLDDHNRPIQDVVVMNLRTLNHTHTDALGNFKESNCRPGDSIQFSYLGYANKIIKISEINKSLLTVSLEETSVLLGQINISEPLNQNLQRIDLIINPVQNTQELLRKVPGLYIAQHAGGGKAEQMFLRGFDIDHGTDINVSIDHILPVNMMSHAHGQGYADLHFVIPETVNKIDYDKGSYNAAKGNFATAGYVDFILKDHINNNSLIFETGKFQYNRIAGLFKLLNNSSSNSYLATEYLSSNGYFESPQNFHKINLLLKYNYKFNSQRGLKFTGSIFESKWNASGQIPQRLVNAGTIGRFGAIDPTEGGQTGRSNAMLQLYSSSKVHQNFKISAYYSAYNFNLYSNFTFFLYDTINGDQINQREKRNIYGIESSFENQYRTLQYSISAGMKLDDIRNSELSPTKDRTLLLERKSLGNNIIQNYYSYVKVNWQSGPWELQPQIRADYYYTAYKNLLILNSSNNLHSESILSPKLNFFYNPNKSIQIYTKSGLGYHSNDNRLLIYLPNKKILTRSKNLDVGIQAKLFNNSLVHFGLWAIDLEDELVYVGDEAVVESSGHTIRNGLEFGWRCQASKYFSFDAEASYTLAKIANETQGKNYVPLAIKLCSSGGITIENIRNFSLGLRYRFLGDRPANEDYSITAVGYNLIDGNINYTYGNLKFSLITENIFNKDWNEAQFATLSRLKNETNPVEEIHFTPGTPFNLKLKVLINF